MGASKKVNVTQVAAAVEDSRRSVAPVARWDFRCNAEGLSEEVVIASLKKIAKHFVFQEEKGATTGYLHYQGRMSLIKKARKPELMKLWATLGLEWPLPNYLEPTVNAVYVSSDFSYVTKEDTRQRGPWSDKDAAVYIPRQYRNLMSSLYPYQRVIFESAQTFDTRVINFIYCPRGNIGKSTVASLCELYGTGIDLPPVNDAEKLIQSACNICMAKDIRNPSPFFVDLPRAMDKNKLYGIYSAIEQIKKGKLFDCRYNYTEWWIDSPQIWVFSNREPDLSMLSRDRWRLWTVSDDMELVPYSSKSMFGGNEGCETGDRQGSVQEETPATTFKNPTRENPGGLPVTPDNGRTWTRSSSHVRDQASQDRKRKANEANQAYWQAFGQEGKEGICFPQTPSLCSSQSDNADGEYQQEYDAPPHDPGGEDSDADQGES